MSEIPQDEVRAAAIAIGKHFRDPKAKEDDDAKYAERGLTS